MSESGDPIDLSDKPREASIPGWVIGAVVVVVLIGGFLATHHPKPKVEGPVVTKEEMLTARAEVDAQKEKLTQMAEQLQQMEQRVARLEGAKRQELVKEYNKLSDERNAEREKWVGMAQQYNEKVARYKAQNE